MRFRKKPVVIDAVEWTGTNGREIAEFLEDAEWRHPLSPSDHIEIRTQEGVMTARPGDFIIRGVAGEVYPCKPDIFAQTYEPAEVPA